MRIGFVGSANTTINCRPDKTFRLASYSEKRVLETIESNLLCIKDTITFCIQNNLLFYRIADFIPFLSHRISIPWELIERSYSDLFLTIGKMIKESNMRIGMHPGQYTVINSPKEEVVNNSLKEIEGSTWILDKMHLDSTAKIQIHVGGVYGDKKKSKNQFIANFEKLSLNARKRLVIENDDRMFDLRDCIDISTQINIPIVFDVFHHSLKNNNERIIEVLNLLEDFWNTEDGIPMIDWSHQEPNARIGKHTTTIDMDLFKEFIVNIGMRNFDLILEIRDKERSALKACRYLREIGRI